MSFPLMAIVTTSGCGRVTTSSRGAFFEEASWLVKRRKERARATVAATTREICLRNLLFDLSGTTLLIFPLFRSAIGCYADYGNSILYVKPIFPRIVMNQDKYVKAMKTKKR